MERLFTITFTANGENVNLNLVTYLHIKKYLRVKLDCKTVGFFLKISKEIGKRGVRVLRARRERALHARREKNRIFSVSPQCRSLFWDSFQTFCLTARAYLNRAFLHDVTAAILVLQTNPVRVDPFSYVNTFFCSINVHRCWSRNWKRSIRKNTNCFTV